MSELLAALAGSVVGAVLTGGLSYFQHRWSRKDRLQEERDRQRLALVREIVRYRTEGDVAPPLNELPLVFGDNAEVLRLYRDIVRAAHAGKGWEGPLEDLIKHLATLVGLPLDAQAVDITQAVRGGRKGR